MNTKIIQKIAKISFILSAFFVIISIYAIPFVAIGATDYTPLAPLPQTVDASGKTDLGKYIQGGFKLAIGIAGALAVVMIIIAGITYVSAESLGTKADARARIENSLIGLLLALGAYIILNTINPNLVNFDTNLDPITMTEAIITQVDPLDIALGQMADASLQRINDAKAQAKTIQDQIDALRKADGGVESPETIQKIASLQSQYASTEIRQSGTELTKFQSELALKKLIDSQSIPAMELDQTLANINNSTDDKVARLNATADKSTGDEADLARKAAQALKDQRDKAIKDIKAWADYRAKCPQDNTYAMSRTPIPCKFLSEKPTLTP